MQRLCNRNRLRIERVISQIQLGEEEQLVYHAVDVVCLFPDGLHIFLLTLRRLCNALDQSLNVGFDRGQRCPQVVRDAGDQFLAVSFFPFRLRNGLLQAFRHLVEVLADRKKLILVGIADAVCQIAVLYLVYAGNQNIQRLFNFPEHKLCQKPVCDQNCDYN